MYLIERFEQWAGFYHHVAGVFQFSLLSPRTDIYSPVKLLGHCYMVAVEFRLRYPIMYWLFYRWWFALTIRRYTQLCDSNTLPIWRPSPAVNIEANSDASITYDTRFALYHPILFLFWLVFRTFFKFCEQCFAAISKIVFTLKRQK